MSLASSVTNRNKRRCSGSGQSILVAPVGEDEVRLLNAYRIGEHKTLVSVRPLKRIQDHSGKENGWIIRWSPIREENTGKRLEQLKIFRKDCSFAPLGMERMAGLFTGCYP